MVAETITNCFGNKQDQLLQIRAKIYKPRIRKSNTVRSESHCAPAILKQERYPVF